MIKGHAVIELKDETTGQVWRTEHDNMITNGLQYCMTPWLGKFSYANLSNNEYQTLISENSDTRKSKNKSIMNHLLGGIFLFQNALEEDVDNVAFPTNNPLTGKASWNTYSGMDTSRGSYNESESGFQDDGSYRHVWDFNTQQANGQISALSLTTYMGGICGDGYTDWNFETETAINSEVMIQLGKIKISNTGSTRPLIFFDSKNNAIYYAAEDDQLSYSTATANKHFSTTEKLILEKKKIPLTKISPFYDYYNQYIAEVIDIPIPPEFVLYAKNTTCAAYTTDNYVFIMKESLLSKNTAFSVLRINKFDLAAEVLHFTNEIDYAYLEHKRVAFTDRYMFFPDNKNTIYRLNLINNDLSAITGTLQSQYESIIRIAGYIYVYYSGLYDSRIQCINEETLEIKPHPITTKHINRNTLTVAFEKITPNIYLSGSVDTYSRITYASVHIMSKTLMTINNLPSPVVKTASQSMKVTYTIQETDTET